jgi:peptidoglycan/xylan/chitin deacetylase (PgdA/CDA1 family)
MSPRRFRGRGRPGSQTLAMQKSLIATRGFQQRVMSLADGTSDVSATGPRRRATTLRAMLRAGSWKLRVRHHLRKWAGKVLAWGARLPEGENWIFFPYYHFVFDDERRNFARQLKAMRQWGDFISLDDAVEALQAPGGVRGRYFCITFDDGFKNCYTNALPILMDHAVRAAYFLPTDFIGLDLDRDWERIRVFYAGSHYFRLPVDFLDWDDCRALQAAGMTLGSHTCRHVVLSSLSSEEADRELRESKRRIEEELGSPCRHFCAPKGTPGVHFDPEVHPLLARQIGYRSFLSTAYGFHRSGGVWPYLRRRSLDGGDDPAILRYALHQCRRCGVPPNVSST